MSNQRDRDLVRGVLQLTDPPGSRAMPYTDEELDNILKEVGLPEEGTPSSLAEVGQRLKNALARREELRGGSMTPQWYETAHLIHAIRKERDDLIMKFPEKSSEEMIRLSGGCCDICGDRYSRHFRTDRTIDPTIVRLCDGRLGKT